MKSVLHVPAGAHVLVAMPNSCHFVQLVLASSLCNATVSTINYMANPREMAYQLQDSGATFVFTDSHTLHTIEQAIEHAQAHAAVKSIVVTDGDGKKSQSPPVMTLKDLLQRREPNTLLTPGTSHLAHLPYSSGTTGLPKGVMLTHDCLAKQICIARQAVEHQLYVHLPCPPQHDVMFLPIYHMFGFSILLQNMVAGVCTVLMPRFDACTYFGLIEKYKPSMLVVVPPVAVRLIKDSLVDSYDLSSVKVALSSAAPLAEHTATQLAHKHPGIRHVFQGFGMTELTAFGSLGGVGKSGNCGLVAPNIKMKIVDTSSERECATGESGEIRILTPSIMAGYYKKPDATRKTFDADGYLCTGDIGYFDDQGFLFIVDRIKELIKVKGNQVAPAELESVLLTHPSVGDCAVIGVLGDDGDERPLAVVVQRQTVTENELVQFVQDRVSRYKRLTGGVVFAETIPKSPSGKIQRRHIRQQLADGTFRAAKM